MIPQIKQIILKGEIIQTLFHDNTWFGLISQNFVIKNDSPCTKYIYSYACMCMGLFISITIEKKQTLRRLKKKRLNCSFVWWLHWWLHVSKYPCSFWVENVFCRYVLVRLWNLYIFFLNLWCAVKIFKTE